MIKSFAGEYARYKAIGRKALDQVSDADLNRVLGRDNNSVAIIVRHISGNLVSRFTDFLTTDGEKPDRDRDAEFEGVGYSREQVHEMWERAWGVVERQLATLSDEDLGRTVYIRGKPLTVHEALTRSVAHTAHHVGQIVLLARVLSRGDWQWISIPRGKSKEYNQNPLKEKRPG